MLPYQIIESGSFTSSSALQQNIRLTVMPDIFLLQNQTSWGNTVAVAAIKSKWFNGMAAGTAIATNQTVTTNALASAAVATLGFTFIDPSNPTTFAPLAATAITGNAGTFIVSMANTGSISVGDYVRLNNVVGEQQIAGYTFQVTAVTVNTSITLGYMASSGTTFAADATGASVIKYIPNKFYPRWNYIANITQANQAVISFTQSNDFTPGEIISLRIGSQYGMLQANNRHARVLSVTNTATVSSVTTDLNTSGFTAFAFPTSANAFAVGTSPAMVVPSASGVVPFNGSATEPQSPPGTNLLDSFDNRNQYFMQCGSNVITVASAKYYWTSIKADNVITL